MTRVEKPKKTWVTVSDTVRGCPLCVFGHERVRDFFLSRKNLVVPTVRLGRRDFFAAATVLQETKGLILEETLEGAARQAEVSSMDRAFFRLQADEEEETLPRV